MGTTTRFIVRWGLIGGLAIGGITMLVGPQRVMACIDQLRKQANMVVEDLVDDPVAIRRKLDDLAKQYPSRIAEVRGEIVRLDYQLNEFKRDENVSMRVVELTTADLKSLSDLVDDAESISPVVGSAAYVRFEGVRYDLESAYAEGRRIRTVRANYEDRLASDRHQMGLLGEQRVRLVDILGNIEQEYGTYKTQLWQLDREIDAIERNANIIAMVEKQQKTLASFDSVGGANSLSQVRSRLAEIRTVQESTIHALTNLGTGSEYETRARYDASGEYYKNPFVSDYEKAGVPSDTSFALLGSKK